MAYLAYSLLILLMIWAGASFLFFSQTPAVGVGLIGAAAILAVYPLALVRALKKQKAS